MSVPTEMVEDLGEGAVVKKVIENLRDFLQNNLSIDEDFVLDLQAKRLLNQTDVGRLRVSLSKGGSDALYSLLDHVAAHYDQEMLEKLCSFLDDYSERKIRPRLRGISEKIRNEMKRLQPDHIHQSHPQQQDSSSSLSMAPLCQDQNHLHQELTIKENTISQKDTQLKQKDAQLGKQDAGLEQLRDQLKKKDAELDQLRLERDQLQRVISSRSLSAKPVVKKPPRNWKDMKCQKILECGGRCQGVATKGNHIAVSVDLVHGIKIYDRSSSDHLRTIGKDQLGGDMRGITFYDKENILVSDHSNHNIKMFTIQGRHVGTIDRGSTAFKPKGITISPDGHIYVCDVANHCVCVFDVNRKFLFSFGLCGSGDKCFDFPRDLCFTSDGFLYITDVNNERICIYDKDGKFIRKFTTTCVPNCFDATDCEHLIVSSWRSDKVMIYTTGGDLVHAFGEHGSELGQIDYPTGVSVDSDGLIYIADYRNHRIQVF